MALPARLNELKFKRQPPGRAGGQIDRAFLFDRTRRRGVPEPLIEVIDDPKLRQRLARAVDQFDLEGHLFAHRADAGASEQNPHQVVSAGEPANAQSSHQDGACPPPAVGRECQQISSHGPLSPSLDPGRLTGGQTPSCILGYIKIVLGGSADCKIRSRSPLGHRAGSRAGRSGRRGKALRGCSHRSLVVAGAVPNDVAFDHVDHIFGNVGCHVGDSFDVF